MMMIYEEEPVLLLRYWVLPNSSLQLRLNYTSGWEPTQPNGNGATRVAILSSNRINDVFTSNTNKPICMYGFHPNSTECEFKFILGYSHFVPFVFAKFRGTLYSIWGRTSIPGCEKSNATAANCNRQCDKVEVNGVCYARLLTAVTFDAAQATCVSGGGALAVLPNDETRLALPADWVGWTSLNRWTEDTITNHTLGRWWVPYLVIY